MQKGRMKMQRKLVGIGGMTGELEEKLAYSRDPSQRDNVGPIPSTLGGRRTLDFVLDNRTLKDFNRTLLFDVRLSAIRK